MEFQVQCVSPRLDAICYHVSDMKIVIDCKNLALYGGGIAHWAYEVLPALVGMYQAEEVILMIPRSGSGKSVSIPGSYPEEVAWPVQLPISLRHVLYDNLLFPHILAKQHPDFVFSPYNDVRMPRGIPSVITVHDLCYLDAAERSEEHTSELQSH